MEKPGVVVQEASQNRTCLKATFEQQQRLALSQSDGGDDIENNMPFSVKCNAYKNSNTWSNSLQVSGSQPLVP